MLLNTLWSRNRRSRTGRRLFADAAPALESLEDRVLLSADDIAGFTQDSAWRVGASDENNFQFTNLQQWSQAVTWSDPVTGDFDGDGNEDVAARDATTGQWWVGLNDGKGHLDTTSWTTWAPTAAWTDVVVGVFNSDGKDDIAGRASDGVIWVAASQANDSRDSDSQNNNGLNNNQFQNQAWTFWSTTAAWTDVRAGDFNGDGDYDIVGRASDGSIWVARSDNDTHFTNENWTTWDPTAGWQDTQVGDFNGDGSDDLASRTALGQWWVATSRNTNDDNNTTNNTFNNQAWTAWWEGAGWNNVVTGDFNDDGNDDIAGATNDGQIWVALSRNDNHFENQAWGQADPALGLHNAVVGDFDDDNGDDIAAQGTDGNWYVASSNDHENGFDTAFWGGDPALYNRVFAGDFDSVRD